MERKDAHTYLMTPEQAALDILYALMLADGHADDNEFEVIKDFLKTEFARSGSLFNEKHSLYSGTNFASEYAYLKTLDGKALRSRFMKAVAGFNEWIAGNPGADSIRKDLVDFSLKLITADGKLTDVERELVEIIAREWNMDLGDRLK